MNLEPYISKSTSALQALEMRSLKLKHKLHTHKAAKKYFTKTTLVAYSLREKSARLLAGAGLTGALLLSPMKIPEDNAPSHEIHSVLAIELPDILAKSLQSITPHTPTSLDPDQTKAIETVIEENTGVKARAELDGQRLNYQVGYIGYEQHLQRFPGDTLDQHDEEGVAGIAPGLGAWRYFAPTKSQFTTQDYLREKYYTVAQTFLLPNWNQDHRQLASWYKYRKILVVNPANGQAVVTVLGDAGPAEWTGKQYGGSPEVMAALNLHLGGRKGLVLFLFLDDPDNLVPLGPLTSPYKLNITA